MCDIITGKDGTKREVTVAKENDLVCSVVHSRGVEGTDRVKQVSSSKLLIRDKSVEVYDPEIFNNLLKMLRHSPPHKGTFPTKFESIFKEPPCLTCDFKLARVLQGA